MIVSRLAPEPSLVHQSLDMRTDDDMHFLSSCFYSRYSFLLETLG